MSKLTPAEYAEKQSRRLKASTEDIRRGIESVTQSPTQKAAAKADKMKQNIVASIDSGKWQAGLNRVSLDQWKTNAIEKGINRIAPGIDAARSKVEAFAGEFLPYLDKVSEKVNKMPDTTLEDSIARMNTQIREVAKFKRK